MTTGGNSNGTQTEAPGDQDEDDDRDGEDDRQLREYVARGLLEGS